MNTILLGTFQERVIHTCLEATATGGDRYGYVVSEVKQEYKMFMAQCSTTNILIAFSSLLPLPLPPSSSPPPLPVNHLIIESLERYYYYYGDDLKVECPTRSGNMVTLLEASQEICHRVASIFVPGKDGKRPCHGDDPRYASDPYWKELVLFYEYFHGDTGRGCGARWVHTASVRLVALIVVLPLSYTHTIHTTHISHQTGWTALASRCIDKIAGVSSNTCTER